VLNVTGKVAPKTEKPVPLIVTDVTIKGRAPVEVSVMVCVAGVFRVTSPKAMLVEVMLIPDTEAVSCRAKVLETVPALADRVTFCAVLTEDTVAAKVALADPAGIVTVDGTETAALLLERPTATPPLAAAALSVTVQVSVPDPVMDELAHESAVRTGTPVPLSEIVVVLPLVELLVSVIWPLSAPAMDGSNCTVRVTL